MTDLPAQPVEATQLNSSDERSSDSYRRDYRWNLVSGTLMLTSMGIASVNLVMPWILSGMAAPHAVVVLVIPCARGGELAGNLFLANPIGRMSLAKWAAFGSLALSGVLLVLLAPTLLIDSTAAASAIFLTVAVCIGVAAGANSLSTRVVIAKTVQTTRQGRLFSVREMLAGLLALALFLFHAGASNAPNSETGNALRMVIAGGLMLIAAVTIGPVREPPTKSRPDASSAMTLPWNMVRYSPVIRRYVVLRIFTRPAYLLVPILVIHLNDTVDHEHALSSIAMAAIIGTISGGAVASRFADRRLGLIILLGPVLGCATIAYVLLLDDLSPVHEILVYGAAFLVASLGAKLIGIGLDTFLLKLVPEEDLAVVAAMAKIVAIGFTVAFAFGLGALAQATTTDVSLTVMAVLLIVCVWTGKRSLADLPDSGELRG